MNRNEEIIRNILEHCRTRYEAGEYPALRMQYAEWRETKPLNRLRILDGTPLFTNTLLKYVPLLAAGASLTAAVSDAIPRDDAILPLLESWGIPHINNAQSGDFDCILDCGGVHSALHPHFGTVELTRSGYYHYTGSAKPVILVDDSRIKAIETCLGTGNGFLRGMRKLGYADFKGKKIVVFGYGKVGRGIAFYAMTEGAEVTAIDEPGTKVAEGVRLIDRHDRAAVGNAVRTAWCVVTATGIANAMQGNGAAEILKGTDQLIAAMGIEDEWGESLPRRRILADGMALNFILDEPTLLRYIDPTMALSNAAVLELVTRKLPAGIQKIDPDVENKYRSIVEQHGLIRDEVKRMGL